MTKKCEVCGGNLEFRVQGSTEGFFCTQCDWSVVTTSIPPIVSDIKKYQIYLLSADYQNKEQIQAISKVANVNFLQARKMMQKRRPLLFEGKAIDVEKNRTILNEFSIQYEIIPYFPY